MLLSFADYVVQGLILLLTFVHPWFLRLGQEARAFGFPFVVIFIWGIWRMAYFDPATHNDIPGIGYIVAAFGYGIISYILFGIRCAVLRRRAAKRSGTGNA
jgi:hypothetical protein